MIRIQSRKNEYIKELSGLVRSSEKRHAQGLFVVEGARLCRDAARSGLKLEAVLATPQAAEKYSAYVGEIAAKAKESIEIADSIAPLLSDTRSLSGCFLRGAFALGWKKEESIVCLVLDGIWL